MNLETQIDQLQARLIDLQPLDDTQLQRLIENGEEDATLLVEDEQKKTVEMRVVKVQLASLKEKLRKENQHQARGRIEKIRSQYETAIDHGALALGRCEMAIDELEAALIEFDEH